jgi:hypothetical protein
VPLVARRLPGARTQHGHPAHIIHLDSMKAADHAAATVRRRAIERSSEKEVIQKMSLPKLTTAQVCQYLYTVATAALTFAVGYDWIAPDKLPLWMGLIAAILAISVTGTAAVRVRRQRRDGTLN